MPASLLILQELKAHLWNCAQILRGSAVDRTDWKGYILPLYAAGTWGHQRRVVIKAEVVRLKGREPRDNPRFVVTNLLESSRVASSTSGSTAPAGTSRTGSRSSWTACRSTARAAASSWRTW